MLRLGWRGAGVACRWVKKAAGGLCPPPARLQRMRSERKLILGLREVGRYQSAAVMLRSSFYPPACQTTLPSSAVLRLRECCSWFLFLPGIFFLINMLHFEAPFLLDLMAHLLRCARRAVSAPRKGHVSPSAGYFASPPHLRQQDRPFLGLPRGFLA